MCLGVDLVLLRPEETSQGSQAPQAPSQAPDSQLLETHPALASSRRFPACCPSHTELCPGPNMPQVTDLQG